MGYTISEYFRKFFKKRWEEECKEKTEPLKIDPPKFIIEHYPYTKKYTVQHKKGWLNTRLTGLIDIETYFIVVDFFDTREEAVEAIEKYKEQKYKVGVEKEIYEG